MNRQSSKGVAAIEFALSMVVLVPLFLGTVGIGVQMVQSMQVIGVARDAARLYGASNGGVNFLSTANRTILSKLGANIGLHTAAGDTGGNAVLILTAIKYDGTPGTTNYQHWVFHQRLVVGNPNYRTSNFGSPLVVTDTHFSAVTLDANGMVSPSTQETDNPNDRANFTAQGNPFLNAGLSLTDLPNGTLLYVSECAAQGFRLPPYASGGVMYSYNVF
jgi:Flp pilus assembly protein TadG